MHQATFNGSNNDLHDIAREVSAGVDPIGILDVIEAPIVAMRRDLAVAWFNKAAADVLGFSPADIGQMPRDVPALANLPRLEQHCTSGIEARVDFHNGKKWFVVRISPYVPDGHQVIGAVLTFTNVTAFRASVNQAIYEREFTKAIVNTVASPLVVLSADQRVLSGNRAFYTMFEVTCEQAQGVPLHEIGNGAFEVAQLRQQLGEVFVGGQTFRPVEVEGVVTAKGQRTLIVDAYPVSLPGHSERRILVTFQDITERKQAEAAKDLRSAEELRRSEAFSPKLNVSA
jgi:two-component system CheB/CheR fusion protein